MTKEFVTPTAISVLEEQCQCSNKSIFLKLAPGKIYRRKLFQGDGALIRSILFYEIKLCRVISTMIAPK